MEEQPKTIFSGWLITPDLLSAVRTAYLKLEVARGRLERAEKEAREAQTAHWEAKTDYDSEKDRLILSIEKPTEFEETVQAVGSQMSYQELSKALHEGIERIGKKLNIKPPTVS